MCIGFATGGYGRKVDLENTLGAAWIGSYKGEQLHFLAYQNSIGLPDVPATAKGGGYGLLRTSSSNWDSIRKPVSPGTAMLVAIPLRRGGSFKFFDSTKMPNFLEQMLTPPQEVAKSFALLGASRGGGEPMIAVVSHGVYTSVLFQSAHPDLVAKVVAEKVPAERRPEINTLQLEWFSRAYSPAEDWAGILACANSVEVGTGRRAQPFVVGYKSAFDGGLFFPGADVHEVDKVPDFSGRVMRNHRIGWSVPGLLAQPVVCDRVGELGELVPPMVWTSNHGGLSANGDFVVKISELLGGSPNVHIWAPPGV